MTTTETAFLYLQKKNKLGVQLVAKAGTAKLLPTKLNDLSILRFEASKQAEIERLVLENKQQWDLWIESASSFSELQTKLQLRGVRSDVLSDKPLLKSPVNLLNASDSYRFPNQKIMTRRGQQS